MDLNKVRFKRSEIYGALANMFRDRRKKLLQPGTIREKWKNYLNSLKINKADKEHCKKIDREINYLMSLSDKELWIKYITLFLSQEYKICTLSLQFFFWEHPMSSLIGMCIILSALFSLLI